MFKMKAKNSVNSKDKERKYRALQYTFFGGEFLSILAPFVTMGIINFDEWFMTEEGWKVGLGGTLALALLGMAVFLFTKKKEDNTITNGYITLILGWFAVTFIFMLLASLMEQISTIMFFGGLGLLGAFGLDLGSKDMKKKADLYKEVRAEVYKDTLKDDIRREVEEEKKRVPID